MKRLLVSLCVLGVSLLVGCGGGSSFVGGGTTVTLVAIQITPASPTINVGATQQFKATGAYSDGTSKDLTATANWLSSSTSVATINTSGLAASVAVGTTTISVTSGTISSTTVLAVAAANCFASTSFTAQNPSTPINTTGASILIAVTGVYLGYGNFLYDNAGNSPGKWEVTSEWDTGAFPTISIAYLVNPNTSTAHTFSLPSGAYQAYAGVVVFACSGTTLDHPLAQQIGPGNKSLTSFQIAPMTPVEAGDLIISGITANANYTTATIDSGFTTPLGTQASGFSESTVASWLTAPNTSTVNPTWTSDISGWTGVNAVFKAYTAAPTPVTQPFVKTVVGNGVEGFGGDGGLGVNANVNYPGPIVIESHGLACFADVTNNRVRCYNPTGAAVTAYGVTIPPLGVDTVAGSSTTVGYVYNVPPRSAMLGHPVGMAIDHSTDCIFVADQQNSRILKFCPTGNLVVIAGGDNGGGENFGCETRGESDPVAAGFSGDGGDPTLALLSCPQAVYYDQSVKVLYVADSYNNRVRAINFDTVTHNVNGVSIASNTIRTVYGYGTRSCYISGSGITSYASTPTGLTGDASHNIYMTIVYCHQVVKLDSAGVPSAFVGTGTMGYSDNVLATNAGMRYPFDTDLAPNGDLWVVDGGNCVAQIVDHNDGKLKTVLGNFPMYPYASTTLWSCGGMQGNGESAALAGLGYPIGVRVDPSGGVYIADLFNSRMRYLYYTTTGAAGAFVSSGTTYGHLAQP